MTRVNAAEHAGKTPAVREEAKAIKKSVMEQLETRTGNK